MRKGNNMARKKFHGMTLIKDDGKYGIAIDSATDVNEAIAILSDGAADADWVDVRYGNSGGRFGLPMSRKFYRNGDDSYAYPRLDRGITLLRSLRGASS